MPASSRGMEDLLARMQKATREATNAKPNRLEAANCRKLQKVATIPQGYLREGGSGEAEATSDGAWAAMRAKDTREFKEPG